MAAIGILNPKAEYARANEAFMVNLTAARGLQDILKSNLGPMGTMKMLVSGAGDVRITKDGNELLTNMQIMHPTASMIARTSASMDSMTGDGSTSTVLLIGEILKKADAYISDGVHPRMIAKGLTLGQEHVLQFLESIKIPFSFGNEALQNISRISLRSKLPQQIADALVDVCVDAVMSIYNPEGNNVDLDMIEIMVMQNKLQTDTHLIKGLVLDHGSRHPDMPKSVSNAYILTCNVSLEYEKTEVNSGFFYKSAEAREMFVKAERDFIDARVRKIIDLKKKVCDGNTNSFVVINQKGIDPLSLEMLAKEGIIALRRAKRRNMERLMLACGGTAMNSLDELTEDCLGRAGQVYEHILGETKYTFVLDCVNPKSVTILIHGPALYATKQIEEAIKDSLRMMKNAFEDKCVMPGGGAVELALNKSLLKFMEDVDGKKRLGVKVLAESLLIIPQALATNSGFDPIETLTLLDYEMVQQKLPNIGLDLSTGQPISTPERGIFDNYSVKRQSIISAIVIASNILVVDDIMRAGLPSLKGE
uniref:T-complex protein 1 subunit zeta n=1 Tax=Lygus hesperus TaxID=30085 RepID=A0A0A9Y902_LYGHE